MNPQVLELYPHAGNRRNLINLYLDQVINNCRDDDRPFIYSNYITSLDGRIALPGKGRSHQVPEAIANPRDWRLFQELAAQADLLITSGRYFRQAAVSEAQSELPLGNSAAFDDLRAWRLQQEGLKPQPDIAIFSASLDIPAHGLDHYRDRQLYLFTGSAADSDRLEELSAMPHVQVIFCGKGTGVDGSLLRDQLAELGYQRIYAIAGPSVMHTLVNGDALDRLYLTTAHCLLGGTEFDTITSGAEFSPARVMPLRAMYLDTDAPEGVGQTIAVYGHN